MATDSENLLSGDATAGNPSGSKGAGVAIATVAAALISGIVTWLSNRNANATNVALAREQRDYSYSQWLRENAYNNPASQMNRLSAAGLNPSLMYGDGAGAMPASASMQIPDAARVNPTMQLDPLSAAQIANINADTRNKDVDSQKKVSEINVNSGIVRVNESTILLNNQMASFTKAQQDKIVEEMRLIGAQVEEFNSRVSLNYANIQRMDAQTMIESYNAFVHNKEVDALVDKMAAEKGWIDEQKKYYKQYVFSMIASNNASAEANKALKDLYGEQAKLTKEQQKEVQASVEGLSYSNRSLRVTAQLDEKYGETDRELQRLHTTATICNLAAGSMDMINGVRNVPKDVKSAATNAVNKAGNRTGTRRQ